MASYGLRPSDNKVGSHTAIPIIHQRMSYRLVTQKRMLAWFSFGGFNFLTSSRRALADSNRLYKSWSPQYVLGSFHEHQFFQPSFTCCGLMNMFKKDLLHSNVVLNQFPIYYFIIVRQIAPEISANYCFVLNIFSADRTLLHCPNRKRNNLSLHT